MIKKKISHLLLAAFAAAGLVFSLPCVTQASETTAEVAVDEEYVYLSDMTEDSVSVGYGSFRKDTNINGGSISLVVEKEGRKYTFDKGLAAHAASTIIYDISEYSSNYTVFRAFLGIDASQGSKGNVKFTVSVSEDKSTWTSVYQSEAKTGSTPADEVVLDVTGAKYLKLYANPNGGIGNDHAIYADAMLAVESYDPYEPCVPALKTVEAYDEELAGTGTEITSDNELTLFRRTLVDKTGYLAMNKAAKNDPDYKEMLRWILYDKDSLGLYLTGGEPDGSYDNALKQLSLLYKEYKLDLWSMDVDEDTGVQLGVMYKKMMLALSLTHSASVTNWIDGRSDSTAVERYQIFKDLHAAGALRCDIFDSLSIENMRWVFNNIIDDNQIKWANYWVTTHDNKGYGYNYVSYRFGYNYTKSQYYSEENRQTYDDKYQLSEYGVDYGEGSGAKLWMVFEEGAVCGGISKTSTNLMTSMGIPSVAIGQPGHCAVIYFSRDADGNGLWKIYNNVGGWTVAEKGERMLNGWGNYSWDSRYQVTYVHVAQAALDDIDNYELATKYVMFAEAFGEDSLNYDLEKQQILYNKALEIQDIHLDAWEGLIYSYLADPSKTESDYLELAKRAAEALKYYPLPMWDVLNLLTSGITDPVIQSEVATLKLNTLTEAANAADGTIPQTDVCRTMAKYLLNQNGDSLALASFAFDGDDANTIILSEQYQGTQPIMEYSLDGGATWTSVTGTDVTLTAEEISLITAENDIWVNLVGASRDSKYVIDITEGAAVSAVLNDLENMLVGSTDSLEWSMDGMNWSPYSTYTLKITGEATIYAREMASGTQLAGPVKEFTFTKDVKDPARSYISIDNLSVAAYSSEQVNKSNQAANIIDGDDDTLWHTKWDGTDTERYITVQLDRTRMITAMEFVPRQDTGTNGIILEATISVSTDGENFTEVQKVTWAKNHNTQTVELDEPVAAAYVRIDVTKAASTTSGATYASLASLNLFEDTTVPVTVSSDTVPETAAETESDTDVADELMVETVLQ